METLGVWLRQTREARDETLRDVEAATRIRLRFLEMLEDGEFDALPGGEVQVRGFLRIYARHLDLSPESVLIRYDREVRHVEPEPVVVPAAPPPIGPAPAPAPAVLPPPTVAKPSPPRPGRSAAPPAVPQWLSLETIIIACIILIILLVVVIAVMYVVSRGRGGRRFLPPSPLPPRLLGRLFCPRGRQHHLLPFPPFRSIPMGT